MEATPKAPMICCHLAINFSEVIWGFGSSLACHGGIIFTSMKVLQGHYREPILQMFKLLPLGYTEQIVCDNKACPHTRDSQQQIYVTHKLRQ